MTKKLKEIIQDLKRCAKQNEEDSTDCLDIDYFATVTDSLQARAVAAEQRRMLGILKNLIKTTKKPQRKSNA